MHYAKLIKITVVPKKSEMYSTIEFDYIVHENFNL